MEYNRAIEEKTGSLQDLGVVHKIYNTSSFDALIKLTYLALVLTIAGHSSMIVTGTRWRCIAPVGWDGHCALWETGTK